MSIVKFVAIDLNENDICFSNFSRLTATEKIDLLEKHIIEICNELKDTAPDKLWILAWREYSITEDDKNRALSPDSKKNYKTTLEKLSKMFSPNLLIIAGAVSTCKHVEQDIDEKLNEMTSYYCQDIYRWLKQKEAACSPSNRNIVNELNKIGILKIKAPLLKAIDIVRTTCYVSYLGKIHWRYDKIAATNETDQNALLDLSSSITKPAKDGKINPYLEIIHPFTNNKIKIAIEICRDHGTNILEHLNNNNDLFLQIILSDWISIDPRNLFGKYLIQLDSLIKPRLITRENNLESLEIDYYQTNLLSASSKPHGPLEPEYPFEIQICDTFEAILASETINKNIKKLIKAIYYDYIKECDVQEMKPNLYQSALTSLRKQLNDLIIPTSLSCTLFKTPMDPLLKKMFDLIKNETAYIAPDSSMMPMNDAYLIDKAQTLKILLSDNQPSYLALNYIIKHDLWNKISLTIKQAIRLIDDVRANSNLIAKAFYYKKIFTACSDKITFHDYFDGKIPLHTTTVDTKLDLIEAILRDDIQFYTNEFDSQPTKARSFSF